VRGLAPALLVTAALSMSSARADCPGADRLQEALTLVAAANPVLAAERGELEEQSRQPRWEASLSLGYSVTDTLESGAAGPNAALRVKIPLFGRAMSSRWPRRAPPGAAPRTAC
jgi:hypothetical protein